MYPQDDLARCHNRLVARNCGDHADFFFPFSFKRDRYTKLCRRQFHELADAVLHTSGYDEIVRLVLLQHQPLHFDIVAGMSPRSEEHTSELQSLMRISYAVFCLKKKTKQQYLINNTY